MRRWVVQLIGSSIGIASFFIIPGAFKFLGFFFSIFLFSISVRATNQRFNFHVIIICMILFLMFGSSLVTFDASKPFDTEAMVSYVSKGLNTLIIALAFGVPIMLILGGIWAIIIGQIMSGVRAVFYAFIMMAFILCFAFISELSGLESFGIADWILDFYTEMMSWMFELPISIYEGVDQGLLNTGLGIDLPNIPENKHFRQPKEPTQGLSTGNGALDGIMNGGLGNFGNIAGGITGNGSGGNTGTSILGSVADTVSKSSGISLPKLSALSYQEGVAAFHDSLPLIAGLMNLMSIAFFAPKRSEEIIVAFINKFQIKSRRRTPRKRQIGKRTTKIDPVMISFIVTIMISALFIFLSYTNSYGENTREDWRYTMFIYYVFLAVMSCILLIWVFRTYTPVSVWSFIKGNIYGLFGLMLLARLFMSNATFNAMKSVSMHSNGWYAVNTFVFIAPAETIAFLVMLPCFFLWLIMRGEQKQKAADQFMKLDSKIKDANTWIIIQKMRIDQNQRDIENAKIRKDFLGSLIRLKNLSLKEKEIVKEKEAKEGDRIIKLREKDPILKKGLNKLTYAKAQFQQQQNAIDIPLPREQRDQILFSNRKKAFAFAIAIIISAFIFSSLHYPVISPEISYTMYWLTGMAVLNFSAGCWMCVIAWRYDFLSATTSHAFFNMSTILMVIFSAGV